MVIRFRLLIIILFIGYAALLFHLYDLQIVKGKQYLARAESQYLASSFINSKRGIIYFTDRDNNPFPAALNKNFPIAYAVPKLIFDAKETANMLSGIIDVPVAELEKSFSNKKNSYKILAKKAGADVVKKISDLDMNGIVVDSELARFYPSGKLASHLLGFVGPDEDSIVESGHYGVEEFYNSELSPRTDLSTSTRSLIGETGADLFLTIDLNIQSESEKILNKLMETYKATEGTILVADPSTGRILGMASAPSFDLNEYQNYPLSIFINPATQHTYEPGSVFKVLTMAAGIDSGKITPQTKYVDTGQLKINGRTIQNFDFKKFGPHGKITMTEVIEQSLNTGA
ncbi:MAG: penicillin-binding transpeptidase domain-containing protein, partial [Patescibacteria group bacterium]